jgi:hypothetical protein
VSGPLDLMEVLDDKPKRILHANSRPDPECRAGAIPTDLAALPEMKRFRGVDIFRRAYPQRESSAGGDRTNAKYQTVMNELFVPSEIQRVRSLRTHDETESVHPEPTACDEIGNNQFRVRTPNNIRDGAAKNVGKNHNRTLSCHRGLQQRICETGRSTYASVAGSF